MSDERNEEGHVEAAALTADPVAPLEWLEPLYRDHSGDVFRSAYRITGSVADAEDVVQTVFLRLARRESSPDLSRGPLPYLRRAATNAALDVMSSRRTRRATSLELVGEQMTSDPEPLPDRLQIGRQLRDRLRSAVAKLSRRSAEMFVLRYFEDRDNTEIAEMMGTTPGTVAVTLHRARARLAEELRPELGGRS